MGIEALAPKAAGLILHYERALRGVIDDLQLHADLTSASMMARYALHKRPVELQEIITLAERTIDELAPELWAERGRELQEQGDLR